MYYVLIIIYCVKKLLYNIVDEETKTVRKNQTPGCSIQSPCSPDAGSSRSPVRVHTDRQDRSRDFGEL